MMEKVAGAIEGRKESEWAHVHIPCTTFDSRLWMSLSQGRVAGPPPLQSRPIHKMLKREMRGKHTWKEAPCSVLFLVSAGYVLAFPTSPARRSRRRRPINLLRFRFRKSETHSG